MAYVSPKRNPKAKDEGLWKPGEVAPEPEFVEVKHPNFYKNRRAELKAHAEKFKAEKAMKNRK